MLATLGFVAQSCWDWKNSQFLTRKAKGANAFFSYISFSSCKSCNLVTDGHEISWKSFAIQAFDKIHGQPPSSKNCGDGFAFVADGEGAAAGADDGFADGHAAGMGDGGVEIADADGVFFDFSAFGITGAVHEASFGSTAGNDRGKHQGVVTATTAIKAGLAAEFSCYYDHRTFE